jgi:DNA-binding NarL/FixJ family response regulator
MTTGIAIVDDDARFRDFLGTLIAETEGYRCVGTYASGEEALRSLPGAKPDVVLMDINLGWMSGIECTQRLKETLPELHIVMLTVYEDGDEIFRALEAGASGYLLKRSSSAEILQAVADVQRGGAPMTSYIARKVVQSFQKRGRSTRESENLSPREEQVLSYVAKGYVNKEIAEAMGIGLETVRSYLKSIYMKLHVRSRTEAAMKFYR